MKIEYYKLRDYEPVVFRLAEDRLEWTIEQLKKGGYTFQKPKMGSHIMVVNPKNEYQAVITNYDDWKHLYKF